MLMSMALLMAAEPMPLQPEEFDGVEPARVVETLDARWKGRVMPAMDAAVRATSLSAMGRHADALAAVDAGLAAHPFDGPLMMARVQVLRDAERLTEALAAGDRLVAAYGGVGSAWLMRGSVRRALGDASGAVGDLRAARQLMPDDTDVRFELAQALEEAGDFPEALQVADTLVAADAEDARFLTVRGGLRGRSGDLAGGIGDLSRALAIAGDSRALLALVKLKQRAGRTTAEMLGDTDRFLTAAPDDLPALALRANLLLLAGRDREALAMTDRLDALAAGEAEQPEVTRVNAARLRLGWGLAPGRVERDALTMAADKPDDVLEELAVRRLAGNQPALDRVVTAYAAVAGRTAGEARAAALGNRAALLLAAGRPEAASVLRELGTLGRAGERERCRVVARWGDATAADAACAVVERPDANGATADLAVASMRQGRWAEAVARLDAVLAGPRAHTTWRYARGLAAARLAGRALSPGTAAERNMAATLAAMGVR